MNVILEIVWAVVSVSAGFLRSAPDYESGLDSQLLMGSVVRIDSTDRYWCHVQAMEPEYRGWINELQLSVIPSDSVDAYIAAPKYICIEDVTRVWSEPSLQSDRLSEVVLGDLLRKGGETQGRFAKVVLPDGRAGWMLRSCVEDFSAWAGSVTPSPDSVEAIARSLMGTPYMWGGTSVKGVDCSGLTRLAYFMNGILLPRDTSKQVKTGEAVPLDMESWRKGDLLFFGSSPSKVSHVAIYLGEGKIIQSSEIVRVNSLVPGEADCYEKSPVAVRRIIGVRDSGCSPATVRECKWYFPQ